MGEGKIYWQIFTTNLGEGGINDNISTTLKEDLLKIECNEREISKSKSVQSKLAHFGRFNFHILQQFFILSILSFIYLFYLF